MMRIVIQCDSIAESASAPCGLLPAITQHLLCNF